MYVLWMCDEKVQQVEFQWVEWNGVWVGFGLCSYVQGEWIEVQVVDLQDVVVMLMWCMMVQYGVDVGMQFVCVVWFDDVVVGIGVECGNFGVCIVMMGQYDDWQVVCLYVGV